MGSTAESAPTTLAVLPARSALTPIYCFLNPNLDVCSCPMIDIRGVTCYDLRILLRHISLQVP